MRIHSAKGFNWVVRPDSVSEKDGNIKDHMGFSDNEQPQMDFLKKHSGGDKVFLDIGAHVGKYSLRLSNDVGLVVSIEPNLWHFTGLVLNIQENDIHNIRPLNIAAHHETTYVDIGHSPGATMVGTGVVLHKTPAVAMDDILEHVDMVKIDIEGFELSALRGMENLLTTCKPVLSIDTHEHTYGIDNAYNDIVSFLKELGYTVENAYQTLRGDWNIVAWSR